MDLLMAFDKVKVRNLISSILVTFAFILGSGAAWLGFNFNWVSSETSEMQNQVKRLSSIIIEELAQIESHAAAESTASLTKPAALADFKRAFHQDFPFVQSVELLTRNGQIYLPQYATGQSFLKNAGPGVITLLESALMTGRPIYSPALQTDKNSVTVTLVSPVRRNEPFSLCIKVSLSDLLNLSVEKLDQNSNLNYKQFKILLDINNINKDIGTSEWVIINQPVERLGLLFNIQASRSKLLPPALKGIRFIFTIFGGLTGLFLALWLRSIFIRNINKQKIQELQLHFETESKIAILGEMSTAIAHELNQPLGAIENFAFACEKLLRQQNGISIQVFEGLNQIRLEAARSSNVIKSIRSFVSKGEHKPTTINLAKLLFELMPLLEIQAKKNNSKLQIHCDPHASVYCDPGLLQQVILNLAKNGFESMHSEHLSEKVLKISVRNNSNPKQIEIVFDDTGTGISSENSAQLFRPFFSTKPDGLGIGLGFSLSIAEQNGGSIRWTNKPSGGAQFTLTLPITRNEIERRHAASHVAK